MGNKASKRSDPELNQLVDAARQLMAQPTNQLAVASKQPDPTINQLAGAINDFALGLYRSIQDGTPGKNLFFSPLSISMALAMTHLGASDDTATQIGDVFRFKQVQDEHIHKVFQELIKVIFKLNARGCNLQAANRLYAKSEFECLKSFFEDVAQFYGSAIESVDDFASPAATKTINDWVAKQTKGKITDLIADGVLDSFTRLVLVNAIYFKGEWAETFEPENTKLEDFKVADDRGTVPVHFMYQQEKFPVATDEANDCLVLEMPFQGQEISMLVILPKADTGIFELESKISPETLRSWSTMLRRRLVNLVLPRFKLEQQFQLNKALSSMGMPDAFDTNKANFEGITGDRQLCISEVIHKAFVDVNEVGCEAAAATAVVMTFQCAFTAEPEKPLEFRADHPFMFMIRHRQTKAILFMGRVTDPS